MQLSLPEIWITLAIGNSRYHWAWFLNTSFQASWDTNYFSNDVTTDLNLSILQDLIIFDSFPVSLQQAIVSRQVSLWDLPIYLISVVPTQTELWRQLPQVRSIALRDVPLFNLYPTLGIDRAVTIFGAGEKYGYPLLVIDGGTALTLTGVNGDRSLFGGAIMPGLRLQFRSLATGTAALPEIPLPTQLPTRWSRNTGDAIASGILHTTIAGIKDFILDWDRLFPKSQILFTGGDGDILSKQVKSILSSYLVERIIFDPHLLFHGTIAIVNRQ